MTVCSVS